MFIKGKIGISNLLFGANAEDIALSLDQRTFSFGIPNSSAIKTDDGAAVLEFVVFEGEDINTVLVEKIAVVLRDTDAFGSLEASYVRGGFLVVPFERNIEQNGSQRFRNLAL